MAPTPPTLTVEAAGADGWVRYRIQKIQTGKPDWTVEHRCYDADGHGVQTASAPVAWEDSKNGTAMIQVVAEAAQVYAALAVTGGEWLTDELSYTVPL